MTKIPQIPSMDGIHAARERFNRAIAGHEAALIRDFLAPNYHIVTGHSDQFHGAAEESIRWVQVIESDPSAVYAAKWQRAENREWLIQAEVFTTLEWDGPALKPDPII